MEQIITGYFRQNLQLDIYDSVVRFFNDLPTFIAQAQIPDRADQSKNIDEYVSDLTDAEKRLIMDARAVFLSKLNSFSESSDVKELIEAGFSKSQYATASAGGTSPSVSGFRPRSPWASDNAVKRR
jgi:hypothetical protein